MQAHTKMKPQLAENGQKERRKLRGRKWKDGPTLTTTAGSRCAFNRILTRRHMRGTPKERSAGIYAIRGCVGAAC